MKRKNTLRKFVFALCLMLVSSSIAFASETNTVSKQTNSDNYYIITLDSEYLNTTSPTTISLPEDLTNHGIETISIQYKNSFIPADTSIKKNVLTITPSDNLVDGATYTIRIFCSDDSRYQLDIKANNLKSIDYSKDTYIKIPANPSKGFNYDYYLYIPAGADTSSFKRLMVEPNNTGTTSDSIGLHDERANWVVRGMWNGGVGHWTVQKLKCPLLVPVFPRPEILSWNLYIHSLDYGTLAIASGDMKRVDLQLIAMIEDAQALLKKKGLTVESKIFMTGFSASGNFAQRFTILHPDKVKAIFAQGTSTLPLTTYNGVKLPYPIGISNIKKLTGKSFDSTSYSKVAKFYYMSDLDNHDELDWYSGNLPNHEKFPVLWEEFMKAYQTANYNSSTQLHTYKGIGHGIPQTAYIDAIAFFKANNGDTFKTIDAHSSAYSNN